MKTVTNKDGSITTSVDDEVVPDSEAKVVEAPAKSSAKTRSSAESK